MPPTWMSDPDYLKEEYKDSNNLRTRLDLHHRFSVNKYGLHRWVFDHFDLPSRCRVLELGCGTGSLWEENGARIPAGWDVTLSDFSSGMLEDAWRKLEKVHPFQYKVVDAQSIPYGSGTFNAVVANHMLYHVPDRVSALREIRRVLAPGGTLFASTNGEKHLVEINHLLTTFDPELNLWGRVGQSFRLENGPAQLSPWFTNVKVYRYEDALDVTEAEPLAEYILSGWAEKVIGTRRDEFVKFLADEMAARGGSLHITKDAGLLVGTRRGD